MRDLPVNVGEAFRAGSLEIWSHKTRSFLSFSAIAFGVAAILYTFAHVNEMYRRRKQAFELAGPGRLEINKKWQRGEEEAGGLSKGLTSEDAQAIRKALPWLYMVSPLAQASVEFRHGRLKESADVQGITPEWRKRDWVYSLRGRFLDSHDMETAARVCLLIEPGGWAGKKPFWARWFKDDAFDGYVKRHDLLGESVRLNDQIFTVVGVLKNPPRDKDPRWFHRSGGAEIFVPLTAAQRYLTSARRGEAYLPEAIDNLVVDTGDEATVPLAKRVIEDILRARHRGVQDYEVEDFREMVQNILNRMREHAVAVLSVGVVAVLAGGVGIMNVTLATIFSRIREIGVRRAIGATRADILFQFVTEATLLGVLGGIAGIAMGLAGLKYLGGEDGADQIESLVLWHFFATLGISAAAGFLFSLIPAYRASRLDPVEALRYE